MDDPFQTMLSHLQAIEEKSLSLRRELVRQEELAALEAEYAKRRTNASEEAQRMQATAKAMTDRLLGEVNDALAAANDELDRLLSYWLEED